MLSALNSTEVRVRSQGRLVVAQTERVRTSRWNRRPTVFGKLYRLTNQAGWICRGCDRGSGLVPWLYYPSSFFMVLLFYSGAGITCGYFDEHNGSKRSNCTGSYPATKSHEHSLHRTTKGGIQSEWNNGVDTFSRRLLYYGSIRTSEIFLLWACRTGRTAYVAPPWVSPRRVLPDRSARVCWKLTFIQIIPARPLWHESVELTRLASTEYGSTSHYKLTIYIIGS